MVENKTIALVAFTFVMVFLTIAVITGGFSAAGNLAMILFVGGIVILILIGIGYFVWYHWFRHVSPIFSKEVKRDYIASARLSGSPYLKDLWIGGDAEHQGVSIGRIHGWMRDTKILPLGQEAIEKLTTQEKRENFVPLPAKKQIELIRKGIKIIAFDFSHFAVKKHGILSIFSELLDVVAIENAWQVIPSKKAGQEPTLKHLPELTGHSWLGGDVELYCVSLRKNGEHYWPNTLAASPVVDISITTDSIQKLGHYSIDLTGAITDKVVGFNYEHLMALEREKLLDKSRSPANPNA